MTIDRVQSKKDVQKYIRRVKKVVFFERRHNLVHVCSSGQTWVESVEKYQESVTKLIILSLRKCQDFLTVRRAVELIQSAV